MKHTRKNFIKTIGTASAYSLLPFTNLFGASVNTEKKIGVCLVGLGEYSSILATALQQTHHCKLTGIVTGSPEKIPVWQKKYGIKGKNVYNYESIHQIADNSDIDVVYIVLPTGLHAEYAIKAANTGKHVWCEKPMAKTVAECEAIMNACEKNNVKLSIGYRMHHEPNTQQIMKWAETKPYGKIQTVTAEIGYKVRNPGGTWRTDKELGGGTMYDLGVYALNGARYTTGEEPISVSAKQTTTRPKIFDDTDETTEFTLKFPSGAVADCKTSVGEDLHKLYADCKNGWYTLQPFSKYSGVKGKTSDGIQLPPFKRMQQAQQMDDDARSIINDTTVMVPGIEGLKDVRIIEAIYKSAKINQTINLS